MSLFDDASLVYIPTGYKATKNYSGKPSTGGADMTFSRASGATRVNSKGLVEKVRTNQLIRSNQFDTTWVPSSVSVTSGQSGYDGTSDAWLFDSSAGYLYQSGLGSVSGVHTISVYVKAGTAQGLRIRVDQAADANYIIDLSDGSLISDSGNISYKSTSVGGEWFRMEMAFVADTILNIQFRVTDLTGATSSGTAYIQDAQLEQGLVATNYIETTSAAVSVGPVNDEPRLTYDPVNPTAPSLLMEPQRTNLFEYSEYMNGLDLIQATTTENAETSPEGVVNAARLYDNTTDAQHRVGDNAISVTSGTTYTLSVFAKKGTLRYCYLLSTASGSPERYFFDLQEGTAITSGGTIEDYGNGWYRLSAQSTASATGNAAFAFNLTNEDQDNTYVGTGTDYHIIYGLQLEAGSYPTSYIPTNGTSVTRVADASSETGLSSVFNDSEGTFFAEMSTFDDDGSNKVITISDGTTNNRVQLYYFQNQIRGAVAGQAVISHIITPIDVIKVAFTYKVNDFAMWVNGVEVGTDTFGSVPSGLNKISFDNGASLSLFEGNLKKLIYFPVKLTDAQLATLTSL